jgi:hypothetical protein
MKNRNVGSSTIEQQFKFSFVSHNNGAYKNEPTWRHFQNSFTWVGIYNEDRILEQVRGQYPEFKLFNQFKKDLMEAIGDINNEPSLFPGETKNSWYARTGQRAVSLCETRGNIMLLITVNEEN